MNKISWLFFGMTLWLAGCSGSQGELKSNSLDGVLGGQLVADTDATAKWVVAVRRNHEVKMMQGKDEIMYTTTDSCTGFMITDNIVVTAAHCVVKKEDMSVMFSTMANDHYGVSVGVQKILIHPDYTLPIKKGENRLPGDLALLKLNSPKPAAYPVLKLSMDFPRTDKPFQFTAIGYGLNDASVDGFVQSTTATAVSFDPALNYFVVDQHNGKGTCAGDSGGPAVINRNGKYFVLGIVQSVFSYDKDVRKLKPIDQCRYNSYFTNAQYYWPWIMKAVKALNQ